MRHIMWNKTCKTTRKAFVGWDVPFPPFEKWLSCVAKNTASQPQPRDLFPSSPPSSSWCMTPHLQLNEQTRWVNEVKTLSTTSHRLLSCARTTSSGDKWSIYHFSPTSMTPKDDRFPLSSEHVSDSRTHQSKTHSVAKRWSKVKNHTRVQSNCYRKRKSRGKRSRRYRPKSTDTQLEKTRTKSERWRLPLRLCAHY